MTTLVAMTPHEFDAYLQYSAMGYAEDNVRSGRWPEQGAMERALADMRNSLPQGVHTPDQHLFNITDDSGSVVGHLWYATFDQCGHRSAFIYDIEILPEHRQQGHATGAIKAMREQLAESGIHDIQLHVFAFNEGAIALYRKLGFTVSGFNMFLRDSPAAQ
tara:strand:+ start:521 stop:1003 length:483 start_codon:yes stop_codon:yes gene_type:complete